jgi:hypothetical protein
MGGRNMDISPIGMTVFVIDRVVLSVEAIFDPCCSSPAKGTSM